MKYYVINLVGLINKPKTLNEFPALHVYLRYYITNQFDAFKLLLLWTSCVPRCGCFERVVTVGS